MKPTQYNLREVLVLQGLAFVLGGLLTGLWIYWPLIRFHLFHP